MRLSRVLAIIGLILCTLMAASLILALVQSFQPRKSTSTVVMPKMANHVIDRWYQVMEVTDANTVSHFALRQSYPLTSVLIRRDENRSGKS